MTVSSLSLADQAWQSLDEAVVCFQTGDIFGALQGASAELRRLRGIMCSAEWECFAKERFPQHALCALVHRSPFAHRAFYKLRGYAGDAPTLDYIYGMATLPPSTPSDVQEIFAWEIQTASCWSVRARRDWLAHHINRASIAKPGCTVLSIACGHLREALLSAAVIDGGVSEFVAFDQDAESLAVVDRSLSSYGVQTVQGTVRDLFRGKHGFESRFDLVYAAGLFDYLQDSIATRLLGRLFSYLRPGGRLLVANFHPSLPDCAGMETMMAWWLLYRTEEQLRFLSSEIDVGQIAAQRTYTESAGHIVYLEVQRSH